MICLGVLLLSFPTVAQDTLRIMTLNIHQGSDTTLQAIGEFIKLYQPDFVALQEIDMWPDRPEAPLQKDRNFIAEISLYAEMYGYFGKAWDHPKGWIYGDGLLSKYPVKRVETFLLPYNPTLPSSEPRQLLVANLTVNGQNICIASTHLCHKYKENRMEQMKEIRRVMQRQQEKVKIVCGDFNSDPSENLMSTTMRNWKDLLPEDNTFPSNGEAYAKYDYMLVKKDAKVQVINTFYICDDGITDHCACIADIVIPSKNR